MIFVKVSYNVRKPNTDESFISANFMSNSDTFGNAGSHNPLNIIHTK